MHARREEARWRDDVGALLHGMAACVVAAVGAGLLASMIAAVLVLLANAAG